MGAYSFSHRMDSMEQCPRCDEHMYPIVEGTVIDQHPEDDCVRCSKCRKIIRGRYGTYEWDGVEEKRARRIAYAICVLFFVWLEFGTEISVWLKSAFL